MVTSKAHQIALRGRAAELFQLQWSLSRVAHELHIGKSTAGDWKKQWQSNPAEYESRPLRKRNRTTYSPRDAMEIRAFAEGHPRMSYREIARTLPRIDIQASKTTVWKHSVREGLRSFRTVPKPKLTAEHKRKRMTFATDKADFPFSETVCVDEFEISTNGVSTWFRAYSHDKVPDAPTKKFAPKLRFWAAISRTRTFPLQFYQGKMNSDKYQRVLDQALPEIAESFADHEWWLLQDNAPWHTSSGPHGTQTYLQHSHNIVHWLTPDEYPPNSPDCNVIENLMGRISVLVHGRQPADLKQLRAVLEDEWRKVSPAMLEALFDSYPDRLTAIRRKKGGRTKY